VRDDGVAAPLGTPDQLLRILMDNIPDTIYFKDREGRFLCVNRAEARFLGLADPDEAIGRTDADFYPPEIAAVYAADERRIVETGVPLVAKLEMCPVTGGPTRWFSTTKVPFRNEAGEIAGTLGISRDVTAQRAADEALETSENSRTSTEAALQDQQQLLRSIIEGTEDAIFVKDLAGRYQLMNSADARGFGLPSEQIVGLTDADLFPPEVAEEIAGIDETVISEGRSLTYEQAFDGAEGRRETYLIGKYPRLDPSGRVVGVIGIARNISKRKQAEEEATRLRDELAHVNRVGTMGEMAAALAHELNQPLAAIANYASGCVRRLESGGLIESADLIDVARRIAEQAEQAGGILRRIGAFVRKGESRRAPYDINEIVRSVTDLASSQLRRDRVVTRLDLDDSDPLVIGDAVQLQQVVLNLVQNASESMSECDERRLEIRTAVEDDVVSVSVSDVGAGVDVESRPHLFEPFFTTKGQGMGMGLAICRSIIEAHGGRLQFRPNPDGGSTFWFTVPRSMPEVRA
jgi:PAS domain S-box-containing protein